jgi:hypothetical protein
LASNGGVTAFLYRRAPAQSSEIGLRDVEYARNEWDSVPQQEYGAVRSIHGKKGSAKPDKRMKKEWRRRAGSLNST